MDYATLAVEYRARADEGERLLAQCEGDPTAAADVAVIREAVALYNEVARQATIFARIQAETGRDPLEDARAKLLTEGA